MKSLPLAGPVSRPALPAFRAYSRQPIGRGPRAVVRTDPARMSTQRRTRAPVRRASLVKRTTLYATAASAVLISLTALGIGMSVESPRSLMSRTDYVEARRTLEAEARLALSQCRPLEGRDKDICRVQARSEDRIRKADLELRYRGTINAQSDLRLARAKAEFEVARVRCAQRGDEKSACLKAARADMAKALADARPSST